MASRWTDSEKKDLFEFVTENKEASWKEVHSFMLSKNYNRTSEACRKRYHLLLEEEMIKDNNDNIYVAEIANNLVDVLPTMVEEDWQHEKPPETQEEIDNIISSVYQVVSNEELDEIDLEEVSPTQEYVDLNKYAKTQKHDLVSIGLAILFIVICGIIYGLIH